MTVKIVEIKIQKDLQAKQLQKQVFNHGMPNGTVMKAAHAVASDGFNNHRTS